MRSRAAASYLDNSFISHPGLSFLAFSIPGGRSANEQTSFIFTVNSISMLFYAFITITIRQSPSTAIKTPPLFSSLIIINYLISHLSIIVGKY